MKVYRNLLIHSVLTFVLVFMLTTIIHEGAHALVGKVYSLNPVLHHNYVSTSSDESTPLIAKIMVPAAGPLISLLQGILFLILVRVSKNKNLLTLFYLWMSVLGFITVGGYIMMTPIFAYGDTGKVFSLLNTPEWLKWLISVVGLAASAKIILDFLPDFEKQVPHNLPDENKRRSAGNSLIAYPVMISCVITTIISLPYPSFLSALYPATSPFITFMIYGKLKRRKENLEGQSQYPGNISLTLIIFVIVLLLVTRLLVKGVSL